MGTDRHWERHGAQNPYWAVLTEARYDRAEMDDAARGAFFDSGVQRIEQILAAATAAFGQRDGFRSALDFGCGVGRLSLALSGRSEEVVGVDISPSMIAEAKRNAERMGRDNVSFRKASGSLEELAGQTFDLLVSDIVFQHIPVAAGLRLYRGLLDRLRPGARGAVSFTYDKATRLARLRQALKRVPLAQAAYDAVWTLRNASPPMQMNAYPLGELVRELHLRGVHRVQLELGGHGESLSALLLFETP
ncbi:MAG: class I SAM-dependent methyltransferase [Myxococcales bacterium]|nr:class I SAM-dependent methyltransferase [Myxococcales bacterium]